MSRDGAQLFVLTGGPGAGKTTLIDALAGSGFATAPEAGRAIIRQQTPIAGRGRPSTDPGLFAELMLSWDLQSYHAHTRRPGPVFFDRGIVDVIGYLKLLGRPLPEHMSAAARLYRYNRCVFVCPPWPEIFTQDNERKQDLDEAERTYHALVETYAGCGYELVEVPRAPVDVRLRFITTKISCVFR
jgi:predicted ATPase